MSSAHGASRRTLRVLQVLQASSFRSKRSLPHYKPACPGPVTLRAVKKNPCAFQIELFCRGLRIDDSCALETDARGLGRTRAGLGSGLELVIPASPRDVWVNAPVEEAFASASPFTLRLREQYEVVDGRDGEVYQVRLPEEPAWYRWRTSSGLEMRRVGVLQGTYLAVYVGRSCAFWQSDKALSCRFCTTGLNVRSEIDEGFYQKGRKVTDSQMSSLRIRRHRFHGDWNYTISPRQQAA